MKKYLLSFLIIFVWPIKQTAAMQCDENSLHEEHRRFAKELCNSYAIPYGPAQEDEDDFREKVAFNLVIMKEQEDVHPRYLKQLEHLIEKASRPCLRYPPEEQFHETWVGFCLRSHIDPNEEKIENLKKNFYRKLKLNKKFTYLINIFIKYNDIYPENMHIDVCGYNKETAALAIKSWAIDRKAEAGCLISTFLKDELADCFIEIEACESFLNNQLQLHDKQNNLVKMK